jgi:hypothetical protein
MSKIKSSPEKIEVEIGSNSRPEIADKRREIIERNTKSFFLNRNALSQNVLFEHENRGVEITKNDQEFGLHDYYRTVFHNKTIGEIVTELDKKLTDEKTHELFVKVYAKELDFGVEVEKAMERDIELREAFIDVLDYSLTTGQPDEHFRKRFRQKASIFQSKLFKYSTKKSDLDISGILEDLRKGRRLMKIDKKLASDEDFLNRRMELSNRYNAGEITRDEFLYETVNLYDEKVLESDDEELKALWGSTANEEKSGKEFKVALDSTIGDLDVTPVSSEKETVDAIDHANSAFTDTNFSVNYTGKGIAKVRISEFEADLRIFRDNDSNEFVYFLNDRYTHGQMIGPFNGADLAGALDSRRIDAYLTKKIGETSTNSGDLEGIKDLPDVTVEKVGKKLIGDGGGRKFDILGDERGVLDKFVELLLEKDEKLVSIESKVEKLNAYLNSKVRINSFKASLMEGKVESISALA